MKLTIKRLLGISTPERKPPTIITISGARAMEVATLLDDENEAKRTGRGNAEHIRLWNLLGELQPRTMVGDWHVKVVGTNIVLTQRGPA